jgi:ankyrin repeat protein
MFFLTRSDRCLFGKVPVDTFLMTEIIKASRSDWFTHVLDYIGFTPARFNLRDTCKALHESVPAEVFVSMEVFTFAIQEKLVNPKYLFLAPNAHLYESYSKTQLDGLVCLKNRKLLIELLDRTFMRFDTDKITEAVFDHRLDLYETIEWIAWVENATHILDKAILCHRLVSEHYGRFFSRIWYWMRGGVECDLVFAKRLLNDWKRPDNDEQWLDILKNFLRMGADRDTIDYLLREAGLSLFSFPPLMGSIAGTNNLELMENFLDGQTEELSREYIKEAISRAVVHGHESMIRFLVDRFGVYPGICADLVNWEKKSNPPNLVLLDFLLSRGADINHRFYGIWPTCLDKACRHGYWELFDGIIERGGKCSDMEEVLMGPAGTDIDLFRNKILKNGCLEGLIDGSLMGTALYFKCSTEVLTNIFNLVSETDPSLIREAFTSTMHDGVESISFPDLVPLIENMIASDPSLVHISHDEFVLPMGMCTFQEPERHLHWSGRRLETKSIVSRYFVDREELHSDPEDRPNEWGQFVEDWLDRDSDSKFFESIERFKCCLINHGADPDRWFTSDCLVRHLSRFSSSVIRCEKIQELLEHGADIDAMADGHTALSHSAYEGNVDNFEILLEFGASIFKADGSIPSAFIKAAGSGDDSTILSRLYEAVCTQPGFDINALDKFDPYEVGAIHKATGTDNITNILFLLERGANPNLRSGQLAITPLMHTFVYISQDTLDAAQMLMEWGADLNARDSNGRTVLFTCALVGSFEGLRFLLDHGADPNIPDNDGIRPIDIANFICRFQEPLIDAQIEQFRICLRSVEGEDEDEFFDCDLPGEWIIVRDRLVEILDEPNPPPLGISDIEFALKYRLDTIYEFLVRDNS